ncbi:MAG: carboxylesterase family protein [Acidobacteria bacterium]|nr:carboxylesterase family protein [Acidobacteriota bacterium]
MTSKRSLARVLAGAAVAVVTVAAAPAADRPDDRVIANAETAIVKTAYGNVRGFIHDGIYNYKGIQYARAERFMPPAPPESWEGVRTALSDVRVCPIETPRLLSDEMEFAQQHHWGFETEDCLRLNVWTPGINDGKKRPVMVWLHGGGYSGGSSIELPFYDGENLARTGDVVVVSVNHRLNILGFLDLSAYGEKYAGSGNAGIADLVAALQWVNGNVAAFGGDPGNVMIFGQSGGGGKVCTLLSSPAAKGLFHKAAIQSGPLSTFGEQKDAQELASLVLVAAGLQPSEVDKLRELSYDELAAAGRTALATLRERRAGSATGLGLRLGWAPIVDGALLPYQGTDPRALELSKDVPVIIGSNRTEFLSSLFDPTLRNPTPEAADAFLETRYGDKKEAYVAAVRKAYPRFSRPSDLVDVDTMFRPGVLRQAAQRAAAGTAPVYVYLFAWESPVLDGILKSVHCLEIPFVFNSIDFAQQHTGAGPEAYALAKTISGTWVQFARTGNPNHSGLPDWPAYSAENGATMVLDNESEVRAHHDKELMELLEAR